MFGNIVLAAVALALFLVFGPQPVQSSIATNMLNDQRSYDVAAIGTVRSYTPGGGLVHSIVVQNPSGLWLYCPQARQYIPPQSLGAIIAIEPPASAVDIQYVNAPTGGVASSATGGPITVNYTDVDASPYQGLDYGLDQTLNTLNASIQQLDTDLKALNAGYGGTVVPRFAFKTIALGGTDTIIAAPGAGNHINVIQQKMVWDGDVFRGTVIASIADFTFAIQDFEMLTPENPNGPTVMYPPKGFQCPDNQALVGNVQSNNASSADIVIFQVSYFISQ